jgi:hypothetical protein
VPNGEAAMDHATIGYVLTWVGTSAWVMCFWWMHRISARQDALLTELKELAKVQHNILREVHPDVGEIKGMWSRSREKKSRSLPSGSPRWRMWWPRLGTAMARSQRGIDVRVSEGRTVMSFTA